MMTTAMCPPRVLLLCPLHVLLLWALLCPSRGNDYQEEIFTRPGSDLLLPIRRHLTLNHTDRRRCDQIEWKYKDPTRHDDTRIFIHKGCTSIKNENTTFPNTRMSENGSLIISNVTLENDGRYIVEIINHTGDRIQTDEYTVHVEVPVSVPVLNATCLLNGSAEISCRVEAGTKPNISLSVIGGFQERFSASANNITAIVGSPGPWNITCTVENGVSQSEESRAGVTCPAPLSDIAVTTSCLSDGSAMAECSVKGSDPRYSWSLNGRSVSSSHSRVTLPPPVSGTLRCDVTNQISNLSRSINISCAVPLSAPVLAVKCHQNGSAEISCGVENGTDPSIYLTVNGESKEYNVTGSERVVRVTVPLVSPPDSWNISCSAKNNISESSTNQTRANCSDPLSAPRVNFSCNNDGSASVSCVLEKNEDVSYNWTVKGILLPGNHSRNITINDKEVSGPLNLNVSCSVNNSVNKRESNNTNIFCPAPPSTPNVIFSCQKNGSVSVSCVVEKDQIVTYKWTLNGTVVNGNPSPNMTFNKEDLKTGPMNVSCSVQNSVSTKESNITQISCPDHPCFNCLKKSLIGGSVALFVTVTPVFIAHWCILRGMKKKS